MPKRIVGATADPLCGLVPAKLDVTRGDTTRTYGMLVDATDKEPFSPTQVFLRVSRFTVDADGSSRAYHPDDPLGVGVCEPGKQGACALDRLSSADIAIYRGSAKIEPQDTVEKSGEYLAAWANAWSLITKNPAASLNHQTDPRIPEDFALYYFKDADLTVVFKTSIIPFRKGVPCTRGPKLADPGYFVAATSLQKTKVTPDNICDPSHYVDA
ncbi:MAG: hypothetical protein QOJ86_1840, partial [Bradyrhizobium sp.]|nr:hypothetical protein [Bradyrhizobium sp.]